jgi:hypothetical protein
MNVFMICFCFCSLMIYFLWMRDDFDEKTYHDVM